MSPKEAAGALASAIEQITPFKLADSGREYLLEWCCGTAHDGTPRPTILDSPAGPELIGDVCTAIHRHAGPLLLGALHVISKISRTEGETGKEITRAAIRCLVPALSTSKTRLCDDDPPPGETTTRP